MRVAFVVGTGRCGSTLLSTMLREHPDVLSLSELFAAVGPEVLRSGSLDGRELWRILSTPRADAALLAAHGLVPPEVLYPLDGSGRFPPAAIPPIALTTLPHLTDEPDALYDELARVVPSFPEDDTGALFLRLFALLADRFGRTVVVERSGGSLEWLGLLAERFPDSRFAHLLRRGEACARSMARHPAYRLHRCGTLLRKQLGFDPYVEPAPVEADRVDPALRAVLPDRFDPDAFRALPLPEEDFGWVWSALVMQAVPHLELLPADRLHTLRYDELLREPVAVLRALAGFLGIAEDQWAAGAARLVRASSDDAVEPDPAVSRSVARATRSLRRWPSSAFAAR